MFNNIVFKQNVGYHEAKTVTGNHPIVYGKIHAGKIQSTVIREWIGMKDMITE